MISQSVRIQNKLGLHARAASKFVEVAQAFESSVTVESQIASANGKSIMNMMMLQASIGSDIQIIVDGADEQEAMGALIDLINRKFDEEE